MGLFDLLNGIAGARSQERTDAVEPVVATTIPGENNPQVTEQQLSGEGMNPTGLDAATMARLTQAVPLPTGPVESVVTDGTIDDNPVKTSEASEPSQPIVNPEVAMPPAPNPEANVSHLGAALGDPPPMPLDEVTTGQNPPPAETPNIPGEQPQTEEQPHFVGALTPVDPETSLPPTPLAEVSAQKSGQGLKMPEMPVLPTSTTETPQVSPIADVAVAVPEIQNNLNQDPSEGSPIVSPSPIGETAVIPKEPSLPEQASRKDEVIEEIPQEELILRISRVITEELQRGNVVFGKVVTSSPLDSNDLQKAA